MTSLRWTIFDSLPGSKSDNFEKLCRNLVRAHFGHAGQFRALSNQPGVEFHIKLESECALGAPPRWYGWQCKYHRRTSAGDLTAASRLDVESSLRTSQKILPGLTDWVLWTPYTLSKKDQEWFYGQATTPKLVLWDANDLEGYLAGEGLLLRSTYFGELILTPTNLEEQHRFAVQPIRERWLESVHQSVEAERTIRRMLGEPESWEELTVLGARLISAEVAIKNSSGELPPGFQAPMSAFLEALRMLGTALSQFHEVLANGDLDVIRASLRERKSLLSDEIRSIPRKLRSLNNPSSLGATNALDDMRNAQSLLDQVEEFLDVGLVALIADAGGGKTQLSAQLTAPQEGRPAGVLLHGRDLHRGQSLDDLARHYSISGRPFESFETLLASLDAAAARDRCRLPIIIDGLNEAEHSKDWKAPLATLSQVIKKYPNVLVVCTLRTGERPRNERFGRRVDNVTARESFAMMALPDHVRKIEIKGFGGDVDFAIAKYFEYFKINPADQEVPTDLLDHPLTLRIFCEVTNPTRLNEIRIQYFPASLSPLLEKYVANACGRITELPNLSYSYQLDEVKAAVYKLGIAFWESGRREIDDRAFRVLIGDEAREWNSSIVNLLAQEGLIFRNPGQEPGEHVLTPTFDALGGYMIADSLLSKHREDREFAWFRARETEEAFAGASSHELGFDVFRALVALTPRRSGGTHVWQIAPDAFKNTGIALATEIEPEYLDAGTVAEVSALLLKSRDSAKRVFSRLRGLRGSVNHPLNQEFLDGILRAIPVTQRDLSWTEWVRENRQEFIADLIATENRWKDRIANRTPSDRLRARWVMWLLTSTDRRLRDIATRALYWFGRGDPQHLFEETLKSLEINDPYVPERMLAASYGVGMALQVELHSPEFIDSTLPVFTRGLLDCIFKTGAAFSTTHCLLREYAQRLVELAILHRPDRFSDEDKQSVKPPFPFMNRRAWGAGVVLDGEQHGAESPFRMDFENYTLGTLVPDRGNYDYKHEGYRAIRAKILWRIEELGWSPEKFRKVDQEIANFYDRSRSEKVNKKLERYGKKYSWIAYFEMYGLLQDEGKLENWRERTSEVDIEPTCPAPIVAVRLINSDLLNETTTDTQQWIASGPIPSLDSYLCRQEVNGLNGSWVALDGFVIRENERLDRQSFCFIRSLLVSRSDATLLFDYLSRQDLGNRWLPEKPSTIYTFAGEIPWCETYPDWGATKLKFQTGEQRVVTDKVIRELYLDGGKLDISEIDLILKRVSREGGAADGSSVSDEDIERIEVREVIRSVEELKPIEVEFDVFLPVCDFAWEGHQSSANESEHAVTLSKRIAKDLGLVGRPQSYDLFKGGSRMTVYTADRSGGFNDQESMFYIDQNLLEQYLQSKDLALIWAIWGERGHSTAQIISRSRTALMEPRFVVFSRLKAYDLAP